MFSSLEHRDNFYMNLLSNVPGLAQNNHLALLERIQLQGAWEVGLEEIFIPSYGFNIKPPLTSSVVIYCTSMPLVRRGLTLLVVLPY